MISERVREETQDYLAEMMSNKLMNCLKEESKEKLIEVPKSVIMTSEKFIQFRKVIEMNPALENAHFYIEQKFVQTKLPKNSVIPVLVRLKRIENAEEMHALSEEESTEIVQERKVL